MMDQIKKQTFVQIRNCVWNSKSKIQNWNSWGQYKRIQKMWFKMTSNIWKKDNHADLKLTANTNLKWTSSSFDVWRAQHHLILSPWSLKSLVLHLQYQNLDGLHGADLVICWLLQNSCERPLIKKPKEGKLEGGWIWELLYSWESILNKLNHVPKS